MRVAGLLLLLATAALAEDLGERLRGVEDDLTETRKEAEDLGAQEKAVLREVESLDREVARAREELAQVERRLEAAREEGRRAEGELRRLDAEIVVLESRLEGRLRGLHRLALRGFGPVLFRAPGDLGTALRYRRYLEAILELDRRLLSELGERVGEARVERKKAATAEMDLAAAHAERGEVLADLESRRAEKKQFLASLQSDRGRSEQLARELETASTRIRRELEAERESAPRVVPSTGYVFPVAGRVRGSRDVRGGIEISADEGAAVQAVADGTVVFADWFPGYGRMVIVDHGGHLHSVYAYASEIVAARGRNVARGETIARVGSTGAASEPALYFEIRRRGRPEPPGAFFVRK